MFFFTRRHELQVFLFRNLKKLFLFQHSRNPFCYSMHPVRYLISTLKAEKLFQQRLTEIETGKSKLSKICIEMQCNYNNKVETFESSEFFVMPKRSKWNNVLRQWGYFDQQLKMITRKTTNFTYVLIQQWFYYNFKKI